MSGEYSESISSPGARELNRAMRIWVGLLPYSLVNRWEKADGLEKPQA